MQGSQSAPELGQSSLHEIDMEVGRCLRKHMVPCRRKNHKRENRNEPLFSIIQIWKSHDILTQVMLSYFCDDG